jgi:hypothetical protein
MPNLWVDQINITEDAHKLVSAAIEEAAAELVRKRPAEAEHSTQANRPRIGSADNQRMSHGTHIGRGRGRGLPGSEEDHPPGWIKRGGRGDADHEATLQEATAAVEDATKPILFKRIVSRKFAILLLVSLES